jgi:hypothetical protein
MEPMCQTPAGDRSRKPRVPWCRTPFDDTRRRLEVKQRLSPLVAQVRSGLKRRGYSRSGFASTLGKQVVSGFSTWPASAYRPLQVCASRTPRS